MTTTEADTHGSVVSRVVDVDGIPISALVRLVPSPRAVIVALHGGAASAQYYHYPGMPRLSLLETGASTGFSVIALDRPGYGASHPFAQEVASPDRRVELVYGAVDALLGAEPRGAGLFVVGHSAGCELAARVAGDDRSGDLLGLELSGTGLWHHPAAEGIVDSLRPEGPLRGDTEALQGLLWKPERLYPAGVKAARFITRAPSYEGRVVATWASHDFALVAPKIAVPIRYTLAEHEKVWLNTRVAMDEVAGLFTASPRTMTYLQPDGAHNLSVGVTAMAYHLGVLAFAEECAVAREQREHGG